MGRISPKFARVPPHLQRLYSLIEETRTRPLRVALSIPPRSGKSTTLQHAVAWRTYLDPACLNLYATYGQDLAEQASSVIRRLSLAAGVELERGKVLDWTTRYGGGLKATSVGGGVTGRGINDGLALIDDTLKSREDAESKRERDRVWNWFRDDIMSRLEGMASVFVLNTRWHEDDLIGRLARDPLGESWEFINMPAIHVGHVPVDERERPDAEPLWLDADAHRPGREGALAWYAKARARGEYSWWSLYQGVPRPRGNAIFDDDPPRFELPFAWHGKRGCIVMDPAATAKTTSDYTAIGAFGIEGVAEQSKMYVVDVVRGQMTVPAGVRAAAAMQKRYGLPIAVEAVGGFKAVPQMLRELDSTLRVVEITPLGDKVTRATPLAEAWRQHRVLLPLNASWLSDYLAEMRNFTGLGDAHDDQVDMTAHAWNLLYRPTSPADRVRTIERVGA